MSANFLEEQENFCSSSFEHFYTHFLKLTAKMGIHHSTKRECLLRALYACDAYLSAEQIHHLLCSEHRVRISLATIYKILAFFESLDIVSTVLSYPAKMKKYKLKRAVHHDHLVCLTCGAIIRFCDTAIEAEQNEILASHKFTGTHHTLTLYGVCERCHNAQNSH